MLFSVSSRFYEMLTKLYEKNFLRRIKSWLFSYYLSVGEQHAYLWTISFPYTLNSLKTAVHYQVRERNAPYKVKCMSIHGKIYITICEIQQVGISCLMQGAQPSALGQPRGVGWGGETGGGSEERGHVYAYGWFMLMYGRDQHKIVKPLSSNWKKKKNQESREGNFSRMCFVKQCIHPSYSGPP